MSKKDYIDATNEIKISEKLKNETLNKMQLTEIKRKYNKVYPIASLTIMCAIIMAIVMPNKILAPVEELSYAEVKEESKLPKVENFENLHAMLKKRANEETDGRFLNFAEDLVMNDTATSTDSIKKETAESTKEYYSSTNVQVEGVDEADIVKTDGNYIYYLTNNRLTITEANSDKMTLVVKIEFENDEILPQEIFLRDNRVVIIGTTYYEVEKMEYIDQYYTTRNVYTVAKVYNIEEKNNPVLERTVEIEGSYLSSRMIGDNIYLISNEYINAYLCKRYKTDKLKEEDFIPKYKDTVAGEDVKCVTYDCIYYIPEFEETSYLNIVAFNITNNEQANIESYLGAGSEIYSSTTNLYVTKVKYNDEGNSREYGLNTQIYKFKLGDYQCTFDKTGTVPGSVLNQFSMDEKDGYFRIATTDSKSWNSEDNTNNLYVLDENLKIVGKVEGLAPGEKIYSVRFMENRAYMVTFVETDPLFVIDLSEPTNPTVLGELKIPGYSKYLHPYDETHLIGFGENTKVVNYGYGDQVITDGMKISLFDVTDPNNPTEMYSQSIGKRGTYSELLYKHKALLFSKEKNIIAFPISITEDDYEVTFQGAIVYGLSLDKGFELKGQISNMESSIDKYYGENRVERIIYIKDTLYTLSPIVIKATDMNTMKTKSTLKLK